MNRSYSTVSMRTVTGVPSLDPVRVITENYEPGQGRIIIQCWDRAWCSAWMAMGGCTVEQFVVDCGWDYLLSNLTNGLHGMRQDAKKRDEKYLRRIIEAVQEALSLELEEKKQQA